MHLRLTAADLGNQVFGIGVVEINLIGAFKIDFPQHGAFFAKMLRECTGVNAI